LAAAIIDQAPGCLCLSEPESHVELMREAADAEDFVARIGDEFDAIRRSILAGSSVPDRRRADGAPVTNYFTGPGPDGHRQTGYSVRAVARPGLEPDFVLGVKHVALYAAVLPQIVRSGRYRVVALIRDPVSLLTSWRSLDLPISRGRLPAGERFWPELRSLGDAELELTQKQLGICELLFGRLLQSAGRIAILRYEDLVADPARLLRAAGLTPTGSPPATAAVSAAIQPAPPARAGYDQRGSEQRGSDQKAGLAARIRQLAADGELPAICACYPDYAREPRAC
jgi:hypothetical protein